jgi:hypothetical protein
MVPASGSRLTISRPRSGDRRPDARYRCSRPPQLGYSRPPIAPLIAQPPPRPANRGSARSTRCQNEPAPRRKSQRPGRSGKGGAIRRAARNRRPAWTRDVGVIGVGELARTHRAHPTPARVDNKWTDIGPMRPTGGPESPPTLDFLTSGRPDSNRGPHRPKRCALPGCATPRGSRRVYRPGGSFPDRRGAVVRSQAGQT